MPVGCLHVKKGAKTAPKSQNRCGEPDTSRLAQPGHAIGEEFRRPTDDFPPNDSLPNQGELVPITANWASEVRQRERREQ